MMNETQSVYMNFLFNNVHRKKSLDFWLRVAILRLLLKYVCQYSKDFILHFTPQVCIKVTVEPDDAKLKGSESEISIFCQLRMTNGALNQTLTCC